jgi:predicted Fe-Mo cluster-binding NifX family protein
MRKADSKRIALAVWGDILSPVFDSAGTVLIADIKGGKATVSRTEDLGPQLPYSRAMRLSGWGVQVLICGAISMEYARMLESFGMEVIGFISGNARQVLDAYLKGALIRNAYSMPGCGRGLGRGAYTGPGRRRFRGGRG